MDEKVELTLNQVTTPFGTFFSAHEHFSDFYKALKYLNEMKEKMKIFQFNLKSEHWHITYTANVYNDSDNGELDIKLKNSKLDITHIACILDAIDNEMKSDNFITIK